MKSKYNLNKLSPRVALFAAEVRSMSKRSSGVTLDELATKMGWTRNATSHRLSHLKAAGLKNDDGTDIKLARATKSADPATPKAPKAPKAPRVKVTPVAKAEGVTVESLSAELNSLLTAASALQALIATYQADADRAGAARDAANAAVPEDATMPNAPATEEAPAKAPKAKATKAKATKAKAKAPKAPKAKAAKPETLGPKGKVLSGAAAVKYLASQK